jgi:hypothetical protein
MVDCGELAVVFWAAKIFHFLRFIFLGFCRFGLWGAGGKMEFFLDTRGWGG